LRRQAWWYRRLRQWGVMCCWCDMCGLQWAGVIRRFMSGWWRGCWKSRKGKGVVWTELTALYRGPPSGATLRRYNDSFSHFFWCLMEAPSRHVKCVFRGSCSQTFNELRSKRNLHSKGTILSGHGPRISHRRSTDILTKPLVFLSIIEQRWDFKTFNAHLDKLSWVSNVYPFFIASWWISETLERTY